MLIEKFYFVIVILFLSFNLLFARKNENVLLYYFNDLTVDKTYPDLMYKIPLCAYNKLKIEMKSVRFFLASERGFGIYKEDDFNCIWDNEILLKIADELGAQKIIFGNYYILDDKLIIDGKILFVDSGLIFNIKDNCKEYSQVLKNVEKMGIEGILKCSTDKKDPISSKVIKKVFESEKANKLYILNTSLNIFLPFGKWGDLYRNGIYNEIHFTLFPGIGHKLFGFDTGYIFLERDIDSDYISSDIAIFPMGTSIGYEIEINKIIYALLFQFDCGIGFSKLSVTDHTYYSNDFYYKGSVVVKFKPFRNYYISLNSGLMSVSFKHFPLNAIYTGVSIEFRQ